MKKDMRQSLKLRLSWVGERLASRVCFSVAKLYDFLKKMKQLICLRHYADIVIIPGNG